MLSKTVEGFKFNKSIFIPMGLTQVMKAPREMLPPGQVTLLLAKKIFPTCSWRIFGRAQWVTEGQLQLPWKPGHAERQQGSGPAIEEMGGRNKDVSGSFVTTWRFLASSEISLPGQFWRSSNSCALILFIKRAKVVQGKVCTEQQPTQ